MKLNVAPIFCNFSVLCVLTLLVFREFCHFETLVRDRGIDGGYGVPQQLWAKWGVYGGFAMQDCGFSLIGQQKFYKKGGGCNDRVNRY